MGKKRASLLDVLVIERTIKALDELVAESKDYQDMKCYNKVVTGVANKV